MAKYNNDYEKLLASINGSGQTWSDYDLGLAQKDPNAGWSIFESKNDWLDAQSRGDKAGMDAANTAANNVRQYYGNYDGGRDGSGFTLLPTYDDVPEYVEYESKYADQIQDLFDSIQNRAPFTYSPDSDVSYQAYAEKYRNAGQKARDDTLGSMAAMTGGIPSSYAMTAAQQAQNNYNAALSDVLPQLEQLAYNKYLNEGSEMRSDLQTLMQMDDLAYQKHLDSYNNALNSWQLNYGVDRDRVGDIRYADETDYSRGEHERELALEQAMTMLNLGLMPSTELLTASRMNNGDVQSIYNAIREQMAQDTKGGGRSSGGSDGGKDNDKGKSVPAGVYAKLLSGGAVDYGTAYAMLIDMGYAQGEAKEIATYYDETYYPDNKGRINSNPIQYGAGPLSQASTELSPMESMTDAAATLVLDQYKAGKISKAEADKLLKQLQNAGSISW